jgi:hypothetical protein
LVLAGEQVDLLGTSCLLVLLVPLLLWEQVALELLVRLVTVETHHLLRALLTLLAEVGVVLLLQALPEYLALAGLVVMLLVVTYWTLLAALAGMLSQLIQDVVRQEQVGLLFMVALDNLLALFYLQQQLGVMPAQGRVLVVVVVERASPNQPLLEVMVPKATSLFMSITKVRYVHVY